MSIHARMNILDLLDEYPEADAILSDYGIDLDERTMQLSVDALCRAYDIDYWELKEEIIEAHYSQDDEELD